MIRIHNFKGISRFFKLSLLLSQCTEKVNKPNDKNPLLVIKTIRNEVLRREIHMFIKMGGKEGEYEREGKEHVWRSIKSVCPRNVGRGGRAYNSEAPKKSGIGMTLLSLRTGYLRKSVPQPQNTRK
ncbi:MAG: hypothetical protein ACFFDI_06195 [Promethearchaeota archaeon]